MLSEFKCIIELKSVKCVDEVQSLLPTRMLQSSFGIQSGMCLLLVHYNWT